MGINTKVLVWDSLIYLNLAMLAVNPSAADSITAKNATYGSATCVFTT